MTLKEALPHEIAEAPDVYRLPACHLDVEVTAAHQGWQRRWPGKSKNVMHWWELANGRIIGWNESLSRGWSIETIKWKG